MLTDMPIPEGSGLLHIGPHKTGSTAIQDALHQARPELLEQGVRYVSGGRHDANAARFVTDRLVAGQDAKRAKRRWKAVARGLGAGAEARRVFSSEFLSDATDDQARSIVKEIGAEQLHVVVTLRPLAKILPSQYQQYIQRGSRFTYDRWLRGMLEKPPYVKPTPSFWIRHRHDELVRRWGEQVGFDRLVVVVLDSSDFAFSPRAFESLLDLRSGTLTDKAVTANRSLTLAEVELLRTYNLAFKQTELGPDKYHRIMKVAAKHLKERAPEPGEPKITTPAWAVGRANEIGAEMAATISASGARVIGDLARLSEVSAPGDQPDQEVPTSVDLELAARLGVGIALGVDRQTDNDEASAEDTGS